MTTTPAFLDVLLSYAGLLFLATTSVYAGSFASLPVRLGRCEHAGREPEWVYSQGKEEDEEVPERISSGDAWLFPCLAGCVLLGMYFVRRSGTSLPPLTVARPCAISAQSGSTFS